MGYVHSANACCLQVGLLSGNRQAHVNCALLRGIKNQCLERVMALSETRGGEQNPGPMQFYLSFPISFLISTPPFL